MVFKRPGLQSLPGEDFRNNRIVLSERFATDLERFLLTIELDAVVAWADNPTQVFLLFNMWLGWRCHTARGGEKIPLLGQADSRINAGSMVMMARAGTSISEGRLRSCLPTPGVIGQSAR